MCAMKVLLCLRGPKFTFVLLWLHFRSQRTFFSFRSSVATNVYLNSNAGVFIEHCNSCCFSLEFVFMKGALSKYDREEGAIEVRLALPPCGFLCLTLAGLAAPSFLSRPSSSLPFPPPPCCQLKKILS
ncbi:hypothetical protein BKA57DRAFT_154340 [Linnemannia elongata]|nr:hypothetical protein BKA57DRAFT_154340 [Linnemannia elongata]